MEYASSKRKENSPGSTRGRLWGNSRRRDKYEDLRYGSRLGFRNQNRIPFRPMAAGRLDHTKDFSLGLGSTHSRTTTVAAEPFSTLVLQGFSSEYLLLPPRSALEAVLPGVTPKASSRASTPAYSIGHRFYPSGEVLVVRLSAIHFQG